MVMKSILRVIIVWLFFIIPEFVNAQTDSTDIQFSMQGGLDLVSRYVWRGRDYENSPAAQPWIEASYKDFTLGAWGSYKLTGAGIQETDLYLQRSFGSFTVSVWDYYNFLDTLPGNFFDFKESTTGHLFELQAAWSTGWDNNTLDLLMGWFFAGYDKDRSYYIEAQWTKDLSENKSAGVVLGFTPIAGYYASRASIVNAGVFYNYKWKINEDTFLPVNLSLVLNPEEKHFFLVAMLSF